ncbi:MAG: helix-turn-helix transcriptional regulator, partial [Chloroflexi bacterium]|nr:helix-turn-helix transcriptional regulator [Chloroflexota bacterium]
FQDYLNKVRIEAAKDMLRNSPVKTKQAAVRVGFKDVSHFVRLFRRVEGMTPAKFARSVGQVKV